MSRHALLVAVGEYEDPRLNALRAPQQDVTRLAAVLEDPAVGGFDSVRVVVDAPDHEIRRALEDTLAERSPGDLVLVHFSCHGLKTPQQRLYFAASNTRQDRPSSTAVPRTFVNELFEDCRAGGRVLLLDCCFSGAYGKGIKAAGGSVLDDTGEGYVVLTASDAFEYAFEEEQLSLDAPRASVFTDVLLEGLSSGAADLNGDGWVDVQELFTYVQREVRARRTDQTPKFFAHGADATIRIARAGKSRTVPAKPVYTPQQMLVARGFKAAAEPVCRTIGPHGRRSVVLGEDGRYVELGEAATIAEAFRASDPRDELGASYVRELVRDVHREAGDGAATAVVIAQALIVNLLEAMRAGVRPMSLSRGLRRAGQLVCAHLVALAQEVRGDQIAQLARSAAADPRVGALIVDAIRQVTQDGTFLVEEGNRLGLGLECVSGVRLDSGYLSGHFRTDTARQVAELVDAHVLLCPDVISSATALLPVLEKVRQQGRPLLVVAEDVVGAALALLVELNARDAVRSVAVRGPAELEAVSLWTRARPVHAHALERADLTELGRARRVLVSEHETVVVTDPAGVRANVAIFTVGALTPQELTQRRRQVERAVLTVRTAHARGVVAGEGEALLAAADALGPAHHVLADALRQPWRRIVENAGYHPDVWAPTETVDPVGVLCAAVTGAVATAERFLLLG
jgi:chaperonin GroEL